MNPPTGIYIYCIIDETSDLKLDHTGLEDNKIRGIIFKDYMAIVSDIPFQEKNPEIQDIVTHQSVVDYVSQLGNVVPIRFGVIFKNEGGIMKYLDERYEDLESKFAKISGHQEMGLKVLIDTKILDITDFIPDDNEEINKLQSEIQNKPEGEAYFLEMKLEDLQQQIFHKEQDALSQKIHSRLEEISIETKQLSQDLDNLLLNQSYLIPVPKIQEFKEIIADLKAEFEPKGLIIHESGPWAPYSFV